MSETGSAARAGWMRRLRLSGFAAIMLGVIALGVLIIAPNLKIYVEQRQQIALYQKLVHDDRANVANLTAERERWNDKTYIETQARDRLYYVNPGENIYVVRNDLDPAVAGTEPDPVSDKVTTGDTDWSQNLLGSFLGAGLGKVAVGNEPKK
ncbi:septum formation initiator family protein [Mycetocola tolaasinivorans]|uniref:Septum formation initiator family protein n=1 Tax=Mycetocola tolaasinivorans TaxID=76635 RepID=A0A3L7A122_9MICO|nr:septum formation initiator family protein [Mycetocola tolaasinivorans]RLP73665.1 septum formation initiator family protein [Mycetocola tolaasinivorans]